MCAKNVRSQREQIGNLRLYNVRFWYSLKCVICVCTVICVCMCTRFYIVYTYVLYMGLPGGASAMNSPANARDLRHAGSIPRSGRSPEGGCGTHFNILSWRIPWTEEPGGLQSVGSHRTRHNWSDLACMHACVLYMCIYNILFYWRSLWSGPPSSFSLGYSFGMYPVSKCL